VNQRTEPRTAADASSRTSALLEAITSSNHEVLQVLLEAKADLEESTYNVHNYTYTCIAALELAVKSKDPFAAQLLVRARAEVHVEQILSSIKHYEQWKCLLVAAEAAHLAIAESDVKKAIESHKTKWVRSPRHECPPYLEWWSSTGPPPMDAMQERN